MSDGISKEKARRLGRIIYAAAHAKTPGEYRDMQQDDIFGIEELFCNDIVQILAAETPRPSRNYEIDLERNPLYQRVTGKIKSPHDELANLDGCSEDEERWASALYKHEKFQANKRIEHMQDYE